MSWRSFCTVCCRRMSSLPLSYDSLNPCVKRMEYAVRGMIPLEAMRIHNELKKGSNSYPFQKVLFANIGDAHAMGQPPLTFTRQLLAACCDPSLIKSKAYPPDVLDRASTVLQSVHGQSIGSYTDSKGIEMIRRHVAEWISKRDEYDADFNNIYLINGATDGIRNTILLCLMEHQKAGVMIPVPQYPLYTAAISELNAHPIKYYLNEDKGWSVDIEEVQRAFDSAPNDCKPRIMVVINPGNPTGQYLQNQNLKEIVKFCNKHKLLILADEVYQENLWNNGATFSSLRKVILDMGPEYSDVQLVSFNSTSKGFFGECGIRGGYMEVLGFPTDLMDQLYKLFSTRLCANTIGQIVVDVMVKPPLPGEPSFPLYYEEKSQILSSLRLRADFMYERFNKIPGVSCNPVDGALYAFPNVHLPEKFIKHAKNVNPALPPDTFYCMEFLKQTGVCVVPGNGFGQTPGTWHFRTTILPSLPDLTDFIKKFETFHCNIFKNYS